MAWICHVLRRFELHGSNRIVYSMSHAGGHTVVIQRVSFMLSCQKNTRKTLLCPCMHVLRWAQPWRLRGSKKRTSLHSGGEPPRAVQSSEKYTLFLRDKCCLHCGKSEGIDELIDQCDDCLAMCFNID